MSLLTAYVRSMQVRNLSPESIRKATGVLRALERDTNHHLEHLTYDDVARWISARSQVVSPGSLRVDLVWVRGCYRWAEREGRVKLDPTTRILPPRVPRTLPRPIPEDRLQLALDAADRRMRVVLALAGYLGLRAIEISRLSWSDVDLSAGRVRVFGKGSVEDVLDLSPELCAILADLPTRRGPVVVRGDRQAGHNTASRVSQVANAHLHRHGVPDTLHSLRHRFGTQLCEVAGPEVAQRGLRHRNLSTTMGYVKVSDRRIRDALLAVGKPA